jgi:[acyl-carrier-protein] S-malonyltransferase
MDSAWMFPGQGSQFPAMGRGFPFDDTSPVRRVFDEAEAISGYPLREISRNGSRETLRNCEVLEPLLTAFAISRAQLLWQRNLQPSAVIGYSAGEIAALYCAGVLTQHDALSIASLRGRILQTACAGPAGRMMSVLGLSRTQIDSLIAGLAHAGTIVIGGRNAPDHFTISGEAGALRRFEECAVAVGAEVVPLDVGGAWHCALAERAAPRLAAALEPFSFRTPSVPFYSTVSGRREQHPQQLRQTLAEQIHRPVLWEAAINAMHADLGVHRFTELGIGRSLSGITRRIASARYGGRCDFLSFHDSIRSELEPVYA